MKKRYRVLCISKSLYNKKGHSHFMENEIYKKWYKSFSGVSVKSTENQINFIVLK
jgi:vacuolar-type H+-ATPase subunit C/Vma6